MNLLIEDDPEELAIFDRLRHLSDAVRIQSLSHKLDQRDRDRRGLVWATLGGQTSEHR